MASHVEVLMEDWLLAINFSALKKDEMLKMNSQNVVFTLTQLISHLKLRREYAA